MSLLHALNVTYDFTLIPKTIKQSFWNAVTQIWLYFILVINVFFTGSSSLMAFKIPTWPYIRVKMINIEAKFKTCCSLCSQILL